MLDGSWKTFMARAAVLGVVVFGAVRLAVADPGGPVSPDALAFAGVLRERAMRSTTLTFVFRKGSAMVCTTATTPFTPDGNGAFSVRIPTDPARCPRSLFDGGEVTYDVLIDGEPTPIASSVAITPVPYARFADQAGVNNDCPAGYERDTGDPTITPTMRLCARTIAGGRDEVVRVGIGASAFWIDRHEASVWNAAGVQFGASDDTYPNLLKNGRWYTATVTAPPLRAVSRPGVMPSRYITWFQANEVCRAAGKQLPTGDAWLAAAQGTDDPVTGNDGTSAGNSRCNTMSSGPRDTGRGGAGCFSAWGAQDMIGNLAEWTTDWEAAPGSGTGPSVPPGGSAWPLDGFGGDHTYHITSSARTGFGSTTPLIPGVPSVVIRGGAYSDVERAGTFSFALSEGPSSWHAPIGFRCAIPR